MEYTAYLHKDINSDYGVSFPDFPGCITAGSSIEEAKRLAGKALKFHIQGMLLDNEVIPEPSKIANPPKDGEFFLVHVDLE